MRANPTVSISGPRRGVRRRLSKLTAEAVVAAASLADDTDAADRLIGELCAARGDTGALASRRAEVFAAVGEVVRREFGLTLHPNQYATAAALCDGAIVELPTGEGKTLAAAVAAVALGLTGDGVHVITANAYLAERDAHDMAPIYAAFGLSVAHSADGMDVADRAAAHLADVCYGTVTRLGFDYLEDNMATQTAERVCRRGKVGAAIVDEADSILIDEARTPLIISGDQRSDVPEMIRDVDAWVSSAREWEHYTVNHDTSDVALTDAGQDAVEAHFSLDDMYAHPHLGALVRAALIAHAATHEGRDYVVDGDQVVLIDIKTGRAQPSRRMQDGIHEALEAKHHLPVRTPAMVVARISVSAYLRGRYEHLCGLTGTAATDAEELSETYGTPVVVVGPHHTNRRVDHPDHLWRSSADKFAAIADDIVRRRAAGQPILVGAPTIDDAEKVSAALAAAGIDHALLTAKNHAAEAEIISQAGRPGAVTVATNMAGRGVDIHLGGSVDHVAAELAAAAGAAPDDEAYVACLAEARRVVTEGYVRALNAGGLCVIGTSRHDSARVDNQLRGRAGRQGQPGESVFHLSLDDHLIQSFAGDRLGAVLSMTHLPPGEPITHRAITKIVNGAQAKVETAHANQRKALRDFDDTYDADRRRVYEWRDEVLDTPWADIVHDWVHTAALMALLDDAPRVEVAARFGVGTDVVSGDAQTAAAAVAASVRDAVVARWSTVGDAAAERVARWVACGAIDEGWAYHLIELDVLRSGIGFRAVAQRDPKLEFAADAEDLWHHTETRVFDRGAHLLANLVLSTRTERDDDADPEDAARSASDDESAIAG